MGKKWRLIRDGLAHPFFNMAKDESILQLYLRERIPILRVYGWDPAGVSIGYFQNPEDVLNIKGIKRRNLTFVRRITAGGALFHFKELTYSLVCNVDDLCLPRRIKDSYEILCRFIINFYNELGADADFYKNIGEDKESGGFSNLCFARIERYDIVVKKLLKKIGGNAQRRMKNIIFQHGSIPLEIDFLLSRDIFLSPNVDLENKVVSLSQLGVKNSFYDLQNMLIESFKRSFGVWFIEYQVDGIIDVGDLVKNKYSQDSWNWNACVVST